MASAVGSIRDEARRASELAEGAKDILPPELLQSTRRTERLLDDFTRYLHKAASPPSPEVTAIIEKTSATDWGEFSERTCSGHLETAMLTGSEEATLLKMLVSMSGATRVLEIGMFTGCAALAMAEALPRNGTVVTCDINPALEKFVREMVDKSTHGRKITIRIGPALETLDVLLSEGRQFDFVFIDADKCNYKNYFKFLLDNELLAPGGTICVDNTLLNGNAYLPVSERNSENVGANDIPEFNEIVSADNRVYNVLLPLRDGMTLIRRKVDVDME